MTSEPNRCVSCRGLYPDPPPFHTGEQLEEEKLLAWLDARSRAEEQR